MLTKTLRMFAPYHITQVIAHSTYYAVRKASFFAKFNFADIFSRKQSNLPPSAGEEEVLKAILRLKTADISVIDKNITQVREAIVSATLALDVLSQPSARSCSILRAHQRGPGIQSRSSQSCPIRHELCATDLAEALRKACEAVSLCSTIQATTAEETVNSAMSMALSELETLLASADDALRRQRLILNVNSSSLRLYSMERQPIQTILDDIRERFSVIKRVPDEIWYEILTLRLIRENRHWPQPKDAPLFIPALHYTHVCRSWRRVVNSSPRMWRGIHWNMGPEKEPNRDLINLWISRSQEDDRRLYERQSYSGLTYAGSTHMNLQLPISDKLQYFLYQTRKRLPHSRTADRSSAINLPVLCLQSPTSFTRVQSVQANLIHRFPLLETLKLQNTLPKSIVNLPDSLTHLSLEFSIPHETYRLVDFLRPSLESLRLLHFDGSTTPTLGQNIILPRLLILDVTPLEHDILKKLKLPVLENLFINPPRNGAATFPIGWAEALIPHCTKVASLRLDWPARLPDEGRISIDRLQLLQYLRVHTPRLLIVKFGSGSIDGNALADLFETNLHHRLEQLIIDGCIGVSRMDCERLVEHVDKLSVYRSE